jgi:hypothetical protein
LWWCIIAVMLTADRRDLIAAAKIIRDPEASPEAKSSARATLAVEVKRRNGLSDLEPIPMSELGRGRRPKALKGSTRGRRTTYNRLAPPPSPKGKTREEIAEMDPDDDAFVHPGGGLGRKRSRKTMEQREAEGPRSVAQGDKQRRNNARRAKIRKYEAEVVAAQREAMANGNGNKLISSQNFEVVEANLVARGEISFDEWTDEELIRGYRKNRNGKFGPPPKWVSQEVVQELHRRILKRGGRKMLQSYLRSVDILIELANNADSEKVRLEAVKELQNRVAGKVPDRIAVSADDPWQDMLADAYVLPSELPPLDVQGSKRDAPDAPSSGPHTAGGAANSSSGVERGGVPPQPHGKLFGDAFDDMEG